MGNHVSPMLQDEEITLIKEETGFSAAQIERLWERFKSLDKSRKGSLSKQEFLVIPELAINPLCDRIVQMFFVDCDDDHDRITFRQFMKVLATFISSSKSIRSRNASRQESIDTSNILSSFTQNSFTRHSRHSSCDGFFNYYPAQQHYTTNQHSIHYVASATHLASAVQAFSFLHNHNNNNNFLNNNNNQYNSTNNNHPLGNNNNTNLNGLSSCGQFKKPFPPAAAAAKFLLMDPNEPVNSRKQKLFFMFKLYDVDNDNLISLQDLKTILKIMVGNYVEESKIDYMAEKTMKLADKNCNGHLDFDEFCFAFLHMDIDEALKVKFSVKANIEQQRQNSSTPQG